MFFELDQKENGFFYKLVIGFEENIPVLLNIYFMFPELFLKYCE